MFDITNPRYKEQISSVPWHKVKSRFYCIFSLWVVFSLNEALNGPSRLHRKTMRKECLTVWSCCVGTGNIAWLRRGPSGCKEDYCFPPKVSGEFLFFGRQIPAMNIVLFVSVFFPKQKNDFINDFKTLHKRYNLIVALQLYLKRSYTTLYLASHANVLTGSSRNHSSPTWTRCSKLLGSQRPRMKEYFLYLAETRHRDILYKKAEGKLEVFFVSKLQWRMNLPPTPDRK